MNKLRRCPEPRLPCGVPEVGRARDLRRSKFQPQGMIVSRVVPSLLPDLHPAARLADATQPRTVGQGRRYPHSAPRDRFTAQNQPETTPGLGRPGPVRRADPTPSSGATRSSPGHPGYGPAVAPPAGGHGRNAKLQLSVLLAPAKRVDGLYRDPQLRRRSRRVDPVGGRGV